MSSSTIAHTPDGVSFDLFYVEWAREPLPTSNTKDALACLVGGELEATSDYGSDCVCDIDFNPLIAAVKLAHDQHRPLAISPDAIWLTICQGIATHVKENWGASREHIVAPSEFAVREIEVSTEEFPIGSPEAAWDDLIELAVSSTRGKLLDSFADRFQLDFSTSTRAGRVAMDVVLFSAVNNAFSLFDRMSICGIPQITVRGTTDDWSRIRERVDGLETFGLTDWVHRLRPILDQFIAASRGEVDREFWKSIFTVDDAICGKENRITGWIGQLFPYLCSAMKGNVSNPLVTGADGDPPMHRDFPIGVSEVVMQSQRATRVQIMGGLIGVEQRKGSMVLEPKLGWGVQRVDSFRDLLDKLAESNHCRFRRAELMSRPACKNQCSLLSRFYQRFESLTLHTSDGELVCEIHPLQSLNVLREKPDVLELVTLSNGQWIGTRGVADLAAFLKKRKPIVPAYMIGEAENRHTGDCGFISTDWEFVLRRLFAAAQADETEIPWGENGFDVKERFDPQDNAAASVLCKVQPIRRGTAKK
ncbi:DUF4419 domain-containing protein [Aporhodopirellula aestuarii]|uniref:DUF4419 domain-containing protein n=1 Tax=Aporhodopirellula aestuarii TaxID=2950107 RepID=A0ABT0UA79_9BACT|nr:DUF4419 domain-containing protein [Aporhodopirellula aestuarii]MCM2373420.1 DUF4419 domain-containing protein [Aporhodopirellula aestuarii]